MVKNQFDAKEMKFLIFIKSRGGTFKEFLTNLAKFNLTEKI